MDSKKLRVQLKKLIIVAICVAVTIAAFFGLTFTKYRTDDLTGIAEPEPALFNTVLLGQLVASDKSSLQPMTSKRVFAYVVYTCSNPACKAKIKTNGHEEVDECPKCHTVNTPSNPFTYQTYYQSETGRIINTSLTLNSDVEFGVDTGSNILKVGPGTQ